MTGGRKLYERMKSEFDYGAVVDSAVTRSAMSRDEAASCLDGLLQWFSVLPFARREQPVQMVESIDRLWHAFILHTKLYRSFCDRYFGRYIDHDPLDRLGEESSKKACARFTVAMLRESFGDAVHPAFLDLTQKVACCFGQCDDGDGVAAAAEGSVAAA